MHIKTSDELRLTRSGHIDDMDAGFSSRNQSMPAIECHTLPDTRNMLRPHHHRQVWRTYIDNLQAAKGV